MWFFRLIRWPNLLIIILTQVMVKYCLIIPFLKRSEIAYQFSEINFFLLIAATVMIASAGYIINDYFDLRIDRVNKPGKMILGKQIKARSGILFHWAFNAIAIILGFLLAYRVGALKLGILFPLTAGILWMYSAKYKRTLLVGNVVVAILSALAVLLVWLFDFYALRYQGSNIYPVYSGISLVVWFYTAFAFLVSLVREIIKDIEDIAGDKIAGRLTLPALFGIAAAKNIAMVVTLLTMFLLAFGQYLLLRQGLKIIFWYYLIPVQLMLISLLVQINRSLQPADFRHPVNLAKIIMVSGILGMQLFRLTL